MEEEKLEKIINKIDDIGDKVDNLGVRMEKTEKQLDNIAIAVVETQEQLKNVPTRDEMNLKFYEASVGVDRFTKLHETLDQESAMMRSKYNRLEERVLSLEQQALAAA